MSSRGLDAGEAVVAEVDARRLVNAAVVDAPIGELDRGGLDRGVRNPVVLRCSPNSTRYGCGRCL